MPSDRKARKYAREGNYVAMVMHEFKKGKLRSSSGAKVKDRKQALAIALSMQRRLGGKKSGQDTAIFGGAKKVAKNLRREGFVRVFSNPNGTSKDHLYVLPGNSVSRELTVKRKGVRYMFNASLSDRKSGKQIASIRTGSLSKASRFLRGGWVSGQDTAILGAHGLPGGHAGYGI